MQLSRASLAPPDEREPLAGIRVVVADDYVVRVEAIARAMRSLGALVEVTDFAPSASRLKTLRSFDPNVVIADESKLTLSGSGLVERFRSDVILGWADWFLSDWQRVWSDECRHADVEAWVANVRGFYTAEAEFSRLVRERQAFDLVVSTLSPARLLRRLARASGKVVATFEAERTSAEVEIVDGQIAGARTSHGKRGIDALAEILTWHCAGIQVRFPNELKFSELMERSTTVLERAVMRLVDSEEDETMHQFSPKMVQAALGQAQSAAAHAASLRPQAAEHTVPPLMHRETTLGGSTLPANPSTLSSPRALVTGLALISISCLVGVGILHAIPPAPSPLSHNSLAAQAPFVDLAQEPAPPVTRAQASQPQPSQGPATKPLSEPPSFKKPNPSQQNGCTSLQLKPVTKQGPKPAVLMLRRARRALMAGDLSEAERGFCLAAMTDPSGPMYEQLAKFYVERGNATEALYWADRALDARPKSTHAKLFRVDALAYAGDVDAAKARLLEVLGKSAEHGRKRDGVVARYVSAGTRTLRGGDPGQAARFFRRGLLLDPESAASNAGMARVLLAQERDSEALGYAERAVRDAPSKANYHLLLGDVQQRLGNEQLARKAWERAVELNPKLRAIADQRLG